MDVTNERIFDFAYRMALDDATQQRAYSGHDKKKLRDCSEARAAVKRYIDGVMREAEEPDFAATVQEVMGAFEQFLTAEDDAEFTFGNAQKLINMTAKYLFITTYEEPQMRKRFARCHCPMDSIILDTVVEKAESKVEQGADPDERLKKFLQGCAHKLTRGKRKDHWKVSDDLKWSQLKLDDERYDLFQNAVRVLAQAEGLCPIEFDYVYYA